MATVDPAVRPNGAPSLVEVRDLTVDFWTSGGWQNVVNRVSFSIQPGEAFGLVGESGCGKSTTVYTLLGYHHPASRIAAGSVIFEGRDLLRTSQRGLQGLRGRRIGFVPQDPTIALTPSMRIGDQILESLTVHLNLSRRSARARMLELLRIVGLPQPRVIGRRYPHQLSGGQQQRVAIAIALACEPALVVLDEPTTSLDVTTQAQILELLSNLRGEFGLSIVYVSHDLSVIATICDRVGVMYAGELVEQAPRSEIFERPRHPYTRALIAAVPRIKETRNESGVALPGMLERELLPAGCKFAPRCRFAEEACFLEPQVLEPVGQGHLVACRRHRHTELVADALKGPPGQQAGAPEAKSLATGEDTALVVRDLSCSYRRARRWPPSPRRPDFVVRGVSFSIRRGETFALVGESGSGKSTIAKAIAGIVPGRRGEILLDGRGLPPDMRNRSRDLLRRVQLIPQNPYASLNPRQRVITIVGRPLKVFFRLSRRKSRERVVRLLKDVRLNETYLRRVPGQLSGGERQRIAIARALAAEPSLLLCDEILSALDVSVQAGIRDLLRAIQKERRVTYFFVSHDLAVVRALAHTVGVIYRGELCEIGPVDEVYQPPYHPYTHVLLSAVPDVDRAEPVQTPQELEEPEEPDREHVHACPFAGSCPWKIGAVCEDEPPPWRNVSEWHRLRCHHSPERLLELESSDKAHNVTQGVRVI